VENKQEVIELLTKAREIFRDHGGAQGDFIVDGKVCALGAMQEAVHQVEHSSPMRTGPFTVIPAMLRDAFHQAMNKGLVPSAMTLYGESFVADVNDNASDPMPVILDLYDHAIKTLENE